MTELWAVAGPPAPPPATTPVCGGGFSSRSPASRRPYRLTLRHHHRQRHMARGRGGGNGREVIPGHNSTAPRDPPSNSSHLGRVRIPGPTPLLPDRSWSLFPAICEGGGSAGMVRDVVPWGGIDIDGGDTGGPVARRGVARHRGVPRPGSTSWHNSEPRPPRGRPTGSRDAAHSTH